MENQTDVLVEFTKKHELLKRVFETNDFGEIILKLTEWAEWLDKAGLKAKDVELIP